jgi:hypothetical protein
MILFLQNTVIGDEICSKITPGEQFNLTCHDFSSWSEMNKIISSINFTISPNCVVLRPSEPLLLTSELNIQPLIQNTNEFFFFGISGVNVYPWPACSGCGQIELSLSLSNVEFYVNNTPPGNYNCTPDLIPDDSSTAISLLGTLTGGINIYYGNKYGRSSQAVCPFLFKNFFSRSRFFWIIK